MKNNYSENSLSNTNWNYYLFSKNLFYTAKEEINSLERSKNRARALHIIDTMLENIEPDHKAIENDEAFFLFMKHVNNGEDIKKFLALYFNLAKSRLTGLRELLVAGENAEEEFVSLREYYVRYKASVYFPKAWFYVNAYRISDDFFKLFIDKDSFEKLSNPDSKSIYLEEEMYLNVVLDKSVADRILENVSANDFTTADLTINDSLFVEGLRGLNDKHIIVYKGD
jgi:hypothetical protein